MDGPGSQGHDERLSSAWTDQSKQGKPNRTLQAAELARFFVAHAGCGGSIETMHEIRAQSRILTFRCSGCGARESYDPFLAAMVKRRRRY